MTSDRLFTSEKYRIYHSLVNRLQAAGYKAYFVGGCVRDELRGVAPHDVDLTTSALPDQVTAVFHDYTVIETGLKHGTVTLVLENGEHCEITTFRTESEYSDNRHPDKVTFVNDVKGDLSRRDFTVNAMAYNESEGLVDLFGGRRDLTDGIIRAVGVATDRFHEDGLRILRALRFSAKLGFEIEPLTAAAVKADAKLLENISAERLSAELNELLLFPTAIKVLREYRDVFAVFIPELKQTFDYDQKNFHHRYDLWEHTVRCLENVPPVLTLKLAALFHDVGKPASMTMDENGVAHYYGHARISAQITDKILKRLRYSNQIRETVVSLVNVHMTLPPETTRSALKMLNRYGETISLQLLDLIKADRIATGGEYCDDEIVFSRKLLADQIAQSKCFSLRSLAVKGADLKTVGIPEGKMMGEILHSLLDGVIDGSFENDRETLLSAASKIYDDLR